jgi:hypothetical protein
VTWEQQHRRRMWPIWGNMLDWDRLITRATYAAHPAQHHNDVEFCCCQSRLIGTTGLHDTCTSTAVVQCFARAWNLKFGTVFVHANWSTLEFCCNCEGGVTSLTRLIRASLRCMLLQSFLIVFVCYFQVFEIIILYLCDTRLTGYAPLIPGWYSGGVSCAVDTIATS